jgi:isoleucyl-tRNA synthetase
VETYDSLKLPALSEECNDGWKQLETIREMFQKKLEPLRRNGEVGGAGQAVAVLPDFPELRDAMRHAGVDAERLAEFLMVPSVEFTSADLLAVEAKAAQGKKCPRCWQSRPDVTEGVCGRCDRVLAGLTGGA